MDKAELWIQIRRSIEELSELSIYVSGYAFSVDTINAKIGKVLDRLNKSTEILMGGYRASIRWTSSTDYKHPGQNSTA